MRVIFFYMILLNCNLYNSCDYKQYCFILVIQKAVQQYKNTEYDRFYKSAYKISSVI